MNSYFHKSALEIEATAHCLQILDPSTANRILKMYAKLNSPGSPPYSQLRSRDRRQPKKARIEKSTLDSTASRKSFKTLNESPASKSDTAACISQSSLRLHQIRLPYPTVRPWYGGRPGWLIMEIIVHASTLLMPRQFSSPLLCSSAWA
jgi:hypothetical protein